MINFKTYLEEAAGKGLTIFDIDETMFITKAKVHVVKNGKSLKNWITKNLTRIRKNLVKITTSGNSKTPRYLTGRPRQLQE